MSNMKDLSTSLHEQLGQVNETKKLFVGAPMSSVSSGGHTIRVEGVERNKGLYTKLNLDMGEVLVIKTDDIEAWMKFWDYPEGKRQNVMGLKEGYSWTNDKTGEMWTCLIECR